MDSLQEHADDHTKHDYIHVTRTDLEALQRRANLLERELMRCAKEHEGLDLSAALDGDDSASGESKGDVNGS